MAHLRPRLTGLGRAPAPPPLVSAADGSRGVQRFLTGTWALRLIVPGLVALSGLAILLIGDAALRTGMDRLAQARFTDQSAVLGEHLRLALERTQPRLDSLAALLAAGGGATTTAELAREMRFSMERNPAIAWLSVSGSDGRFRGMRRTADGVELQESRDGVETRYGFDAAGGLHELRRRITDYDPRTRPFYLTAIAARDRVWTEPYTFYDDHVTGITCTQALRDNDGRVQAVLSLDFDSDSLGACLSQLPVIPGSRSVVISGDGVVLGCTGEPLRGHGGNRVMKLLDLPDPHLLALVQTLIGGGPRNGSLQRDQGIRIAARPVSPAPGQTWQVISYAPEAEILAAAGSLRGRAAAVGVAAILMSALVGWLVAGALSRVRRERAEAREQARQALAAADELGSYRLVKLLGEGGMGEVWRAEHRQLARPAAIKLMRPGAEQDTETLRSRFTREARVIAGLHCRHTVSLYDYGVSDDGSLYYVMELLDGLDLEQLVSRFGPVGPRRAVAILRQACRSLAEAHAQGLVHRDIKPANIYLCRQADEVDVVKVLDFGLVLPVQRTGEAGRGSPESGRLSIPGMVFGTPTCMAPEQARGLELGGRADLYALGCVAWWLLTGRTVFDAADAVGLLLAHVNTPVPDLAALRPDLPAELVRLVADLLAKDPARRAADASEVLARLRALGDPGGEPWDEDIAAIWWRRNLPAADQPPGPGTGAPTAPVPALATAPSLPLPGV